MPEHLQPERQVRQPQEQVQQGHPQTLVLLGASGSGKTTLAWHLALHYRDAFLRGVQPVGFPTPVPTGTTGRGVTLSAVPYTHPRTHNIVLSLLSSILL